MKPEPISVYILEASLLLLLLTPQQTSPRPGACGQSTKSHREWKLEDKSYCWLSSNQLVGIGNSPIQLALWYRLHLSVKLMWSSSSQWPSHALTKGIAGWSAEIPVANTQPGDMDVITLPHIWLRTSSSHHSLLVCALFYHARPEGNHSVGSLSRTRRLEKDTNHYSTKFIWNEKSKILKSLDQRFSIFPCIRMTSWKIDGKLPIE